jgi:multiple antibiotic resistance protein
MDFFIITILLYLIMDPIGNITSFLKLINQVPPERQRWVTIREMLIALAALLLFEVLGDYIFSVLQVSEPTVKVASGVILFLIAIKILFSSKTSLRANLPNEEPFIVPLAIPLIAGPSALASVMLFARIEDSHLIMIGAIFTAWAAAVVTLLLAKPLLKTLGRNGLLACERLMGMVLVMLSIQRFLEGIRQFITQYCCA